MIYPVTSLMLPLFFGLLTSVSAFIGMGEDMYNPSCAYACRAVIATALIDCPSGSIAEQHSADTPVTVTPSCRAESSPFLTTLAVCINDRCFPDFWPTREKLEWYWYKEATGDSMLAPMWGWQEAYDKVNVTPTAVFDVSAKLDDTVLVSRDAWLAVKLKQDALEWQLISYSKYA